MLHARTRWLAVMALLLITETNLVNSSRILAVFPFQSKSHTIMGSALMKELARLGHEVTMITHFPEKEKITNYTDIHVRTTMMDVLGDKSGSANRHFEDDNRGIMEKMKMVIFFLLQANVLTCDMMLQEEGVNRLIQDEAAHFDLVIMEAFFNECFLGFVHKFKAPLIQVCTFGGSPWMSDWFGNPHPFSYVPEALSPFTDRMTFWERMKNTLMGTGMRIMRTFMYIPGQDANMKKHFGFLEDLPSLSNIEYNTSLLFLNNHFSISYPRPLMPAMVQVGGLHLKPPKKLPQDLQKYLDDAPNGVVYFSMGSNLQSTQLPDSKRNALLEAFSQLKQKVLWKWEEDTLPGQPKNVKLGKWLPQTDILAHPNVRLFITHGGLLSVQEAFHRGVPMVGIPIFADQVTNMNKVQLSGVGSVLDFKTMTTESVKRIVTEVLENPSYAENAQRISKIFRDQPLTPMETAVFWTEYVLRHRGAPHMRSAALDLSWYQYFLLDVTAVLVLAATAVISVLILICRALFRCCTGKTIDKTKKRN